VGTTLTAYRRARIRQLAATRRDVTGLLAAVLTEFGVEIGREHADRLGSADAVYELVAEHAGWPFAA
jgi:hypothetical protein